MIDLLTTFFKKLEQKLETSTIKKAQIELLNHIKMTCEFDEEQISERDILTKIFEIGVLNGMLIHSVDNKVQDTSSRDARAIRIERDEKGILHIITGTIDEHIKKVSIEGDDDLPF